MRAVKFALVMCAISFTLIQTTFADSIEWNAADGNWTNAANWVGGSAPVSSVQANINNDGTCKMDSLILSEANRIDVGGKAGTLNKLEILPGTVHTNSGIRLGQSSGASTGTVFQSGGWIYSTGWNFVYKGSQWLTTGGYYRNPGNANFLVHGGGAVIQTGGTNSLHQVRIGEGSAADGSALYEISGGRFDATWQVLVANDPAIHSVFHINGSQAAVFGNANNNERLKLNGTNAELRVTLDASGCSPFILDEGGGTRYANISNAVLTVNSDLYSGELLASTVTVIQADNTIGTLSQTNFMGNVISADAFIEDGDLKIRNIVLHSKAPEGTLVLIN